MRKTNKKLQPSPWTWARNFFLLSWFLRRICTGHNVGLTFEVIEHRLIEAGRVRLHPLREPFQAVAGAS